MKSILAACSSDFSHCTTELCRGTFDIGTTEVVTTNGSRHYERQPSIMKIGLLLSIVSLYVFPCDSLSQVKVGAELLFEKHFHLIEGKRVALVVNHTAVLNDGGHLADAMFENPKTKLAGLAQQYGSCVATRME